MNSTLKFIFTLMLLPPCITSQQSYSGDAVHLCSGRDRAMPPQSLSYTCNGQSSSCRALLIFTAMSPYDTVAAIANLTSSDQNEISRMNNVTKFEVLPEETYFIIANKTFQGFTSCHALKRANAYPETGLLPGQRLLVPLRCACPTVKQAAAGMKFLLTDESPIIRPFTTMLIPLPREPSQWHPHRSPDSPPLPLPVVLKSRSNRVVLIVGVAAGAFSLLILLLLALFFQSRRRTQVPQSRGRNAKVPSPEDLILEIAKLDRVLKVYKFSEIKRATRDFRSKRRMNDHGYRATFNREVLAVKKSSGNPDHEMKMLVYEYMANGTLREWLSRRGSQSWNQRIRIALDVANGLLYLHNFANPAYVHNDVTSSNILLDNNLNVLMQVQLLPRMYMPLEYYCWS